MTTLERRHSERARIPCNIPVELTDASRNAQFDADAVDLSVGGLSLRSSRVPAIGSQLFCSFEAMPGGAQVLGRGEVVWRQPADGEGGEFGLRFIEVDPKTQALIDEMVAERIARIDTPFTQPKLEPVVANLEIENVPAPVPARLVHTSETEAMFEQSLDQFTVGKSVIAHAGVSLVRGHIASVKLRMEGTTPRLVLTLQLPRDPSRFGEFEWGEPGSDTDPDVFEYAARDKASKISDAEFDTQTYADSEELELDTETDSNVDTIEEADEGEGEGEGEGHEALDADEAEEGDDDDSQDVLELSDVELQEEDVLPAFRRERDRSRTLAGVGGAAAMYDAAVHSAQTVRTAPVTAADTTGPVTANKTDADPLALFRRGATLREGDPGRLQLSLDEASVAVPRVKADEESIMALLTSPPAGATTTGAAAVQPSAAGTTGDGEADDSESLPVYEEPSNAPFVRFLRVLARFVETGRGISERTRELGDRAREVATQRFGRGVFTRPRRVAASSSREAKPNHTKVRWIAIGVASLVALGFVGYALVPGGDLYPHRDVEEQAQDESGHKPDLQANAQDHANGTASDVSAATAAASDNKSGVATAQFGQRQVRNPKRFLLRMSEPVKLLQGTSDADGFSVIISDNHALDRAAPIKAGHPSVARAAILNRRDHSAELIVRFAAGQSPAFRVTGHGSALEILIEQPGEPLSP